MSKQLRHDENVSFYHDGGLYLNRKIIAFSILLRYFPCSHSVLWSLNDICSDLHKLKPRKKEMKKVCLLESPWSELWIEDCNKDCVHGFYVNNDNYNCHLVYKSKLYGLS